MLMIKVSLCLVCALVSACSTVGGMYKQDDPEHGEFSLEKTVLTVIGVIGTAALLHNTPRDDEYDKNSWWYNPWVEY